MSQTVREVPRILTRELHHMDEGADLGFYFFLILCVLTSYVLAELQNGCLYLNVFVSLSLMCVCLIK